MSAMELQPEYIRDMHNHYMVLKGKKEDASNYTAKMLMSNSVSGILQTELRHLDSLDLYYYDITAKKALKNIYEGKSIDYETTKRIIKDVLEIIENSEEYLLVEHDFIISPDFIFMDNNNEIGLCYLPGLSNNILEQLSYFFEYIMNKIDYKDESVVRLIYALYKESKDVECTFYKLYDVINQPHNTQSMEKKEDSKEDNPQEAAIKASILAKQNLQVNSSHKKTFKAGNDFVNHIKVNLNLKDKAVFNKKEGRRGPDRKGISNVINKNQNEVRENYHIKGETDKSEIVNEREFLYFGRLNYILAGSSMIAGIIILVIIYFSEMVSNSLGNGIDQVKMFACILTVICLEIYIMTKIFNSNKKLTKMMTVVEYTQEDERDIGRSMSLDSKTLSNNSLNSNSLVSNQEVREEKTEILWEDNSHNEEERTQLLAYAENLKFYYLTPIKSKAMDKDKMIKSKVLEYPFYIGKNSNLSNLVIEDNSISRRHGVITRMEDKIFYTDLESTNGTFINGKKLEGNKAYVLTPFDEISFANIKYLWEELEG